MYKKILYLLSATYVTIAPLLHQAYASASYQEETEITKKQSYLLLGLVGLAGLSSGIVITYLTMQKTGSQPGGETTNLQNTINQLKQEINQKNQQIASLQHREEPAKDPDNNQPNIHQLALTEAQKKLLNSLLEQSQNIQANNFSQEPKRTIHATLLGKKISFTAIEANINQFNLGATACCSIAGGLAAILLDFQEANSEIANFIVTYSAGYTSQAHTSFKEAFDHITLYQNILEKPNIDGCLMPGEHQENVKNMQNFIQFIAQYAPINIEVTQIGQSFFFHIKKNKHVVLFDTHARYAPDRTYKLQKSHFLIFQNLENFTPYIQNLCTVEDTDQIINDPRAMPGQAQALLEVSYNFFKVKDNADKTAIFKKDTIVQTFKEFEKLAKHIEGDPIAGRT